MTRPDPEPQTEQTGLRVSVSGLTHTARGVRTFHTDDITPAAEAIDRFIADGHPGHLLLTTEAPMPGRTVTVTTIDGTDETRLATITRTLTVYRRDDHGFATYWYGDHDTGQTWHTHTDRPAPHRPWDLDGHDFHGQVPANAILPIGQLHQAMREFTETGHHPSGIDWNKIP